MSTFSIVASRGRPIEPNRWHVEEGRGVSVSLDAELRTRLEKEPGDPTYIVCNGTTADFKRLKPGSGSNVGGETTLLIDTTVRLEGLKLDLIIIEYDASRRRIHDSKLALGKLIQLTTQTATAHVLISIRMARSGSVTFRALNVQEVVLPAAKPGARTLPESAKQGVKHDVSLTGLRDSAAQLAIIAQSHHSALAAQAEVVDNLEASTEKPTASSARDNLAPVAAFREERFRESLIKIAESLPNSNGSRHFSAIPLTAGIISDEYMFNFYKDVFENVVYLRPSEWASQIAEQPLDVIIYITCWKGMEDEDWRGIKFRPSPSNALAGILDYAEENGVPTVFQSIEDPSNYDYFLPVAEQFDYIFTSDSECVPKYIEDLGHERVYYGEYGANPLINNPIGIFEFDFDSAFFAGSYPSRYPERCHDMNIAFRSISAVHDRHLVIADRNFGTTEFAYPEEYETNIIGPFRHDVLQKVHKLYRYSLNFNSIKSSPTMCAMRVYELQAQGVGLISNYARSVLNKFPHVRTVASEVDLSIEFNRDVSHQQMRLALAGVDSILTCRTSYDVVERMMQKVGLPGPKRRSEHILVLGLGDKSESREAFERQDHHSGVYCHIEDLPAEVLTLGSFGYIAFMDSAFSYERDYLRSRLNVFKYVDVDFVSQGEMLQPFTSVTRDSLTYTDSALDPALTVYSVEDPTVGLIHDLRLGNSLGRGFNADPYHVGYRETVRLEMAELMPGDWEPELSVIIPVYNNYEFLFTKCIPSLLRNESFPRFEVIIVDDGSTDERAEEYLYDLRLMYPNLRTFRFNDGGSGSASRPRNRGVEMAKAPLLAFLDPDNEISPKGYDRLIEHYHDSEVASREVNFVSGYQVKVGVEAKITGRHAVGQPITLNMPGEHFFTRGRFPVVSTQAAVIERSWLIESGVRFVEGAAGQDTLYGWELLMRSRSCMFVDDVHLIYYAEREGSVTNEVSSKYFEKCLILEKAQFKALSETGYLESFLENHFQNFVLNWYLPRLQRVPYGEREAAEQALAEIIEIYGGDVSVFPSLNEGSVR